MAVVPITTVGLTTNYPVPYRSVSTAPSARYLRSHTLELAENVEAHRSLLALYCGILQDSSGFRTLTAGAGMGCGFDANCARVAAPIPLASGDGSQSVLSLRTAGVFQGGSTMSDDLAVPFDLATIGFQPVDALALARELLESEQARKDGRAARTLGKSRGLTTVLTVLRAGGHLGEHRAPGPLAIVPVVGRATFVGPSGEEHPVSVGQTLFVGEGQTHRVTAGEDSAFLVVIGLQNGLQNGPPS